MSVRLPFRLLGTFACLLTVAASVAASVGSPSPVPWLQTLGLVVFASAAAVNLYARRLRPAVAAVLLAAMGVSLIGAYWAQPIGVPVGMFVLAALAPLRSAVRTMLIVLSLVAILFCAVQVPSGHETVPTAAAVIAGMAFFAGVGVVLLSERRQRERVVNLLADLEQARAAERAASAIAARTTAAREVHDVLAHTLSGLIIQLEAARLQARASHADEHLQTSVDNALRSARSGLGEARRAVGALRGIRPPGVADIPSLIDEHRLMTGTVAALNVVGAAKALSDDAGLALYRATQEALSNVRKHAKGARVDLLLRWESDRVILRVANSLTATAAGEAGWGLTGISERVSALGGTFEATATGTQYVVAVELPLDDAPD